MTVLSFVDVRFLAPAGIFAAAACTAFFGSRQYAKAASLEEELKAEKLRSESFSASLCRTAGELHKAESRVKLALEASEKFSAEIAEVTELSSQYLIDREASRKALATEVETRVKFQNEAAYLKGELDAERSAHNELKSKHNRFLNTRNEILTDLNTALRKNEEWEQRFEAFQRMESEGFYRDRLNKRIKELEWLCRSQVIEIERLRECRPARAANGRFTKRSPESDFSVSVG